MGRRKITIQQIADIKMRHITFNKRKNGLFKKAAELSVLCDLNLLLVCEDGLGNVIQFSKNKINDIGSFLSQCRYQNLIDLTSDDYPDFAKINKKKEKDHNDPDSGLEDDSTPPIPTQKDKNIRTFQEMEAQHKESNVQTKKKALAQENRISQESFIENPAQRTKARQMNGMTSVPEQPSGMNVPESHESLQKKIKNKLNLKLNIPKQETVPEAQHPQVVVQNGIRVPVTNPGGDNSNNIGGGASNMERIQMQKVNNNFSQVQAMPIEKPMEFPSASPSFMSFMDLKRFGSFYEPPSSSPFKFYSQNNRMDPSLNSVLKGVSPFTFQMTGTPLMPKMGLGDSEPLDTANALRFMSRTVGQDLAGSAHSTHKVFNFGSDETQAPVNQTQSRNDMLAATQRSFNAQNPMQNQFQNQMHMQMQMQMQMQQMQDYNNLPSVPKSENDFDMNLPSALPSGLPSGALSSRRFDFGFFKD